MLPSLALTMKTKSNSPIRERVYAKAKKSRIGVRKELHAVRRAQTERAESGRKCRCRFSPSATPVWAEAPKKRHFYSRFFHDDENDPRSPTAALSIRKHRKSHISLVSARAEKDEDENTGTETD